MEHELITRKKIYEELIECIKELHVFSHLEEPVYNYIKLLHIEIEGLRELMEFLNKFNLDAILIVKEGGDAS